MCLCLCYENCVTLTVSPERAWTASDSSPCPPQNTKGGLNVANTCMLFVDWNAARSNPSVRDKNIQHPNSISGRSALWQLRRGQCSLVKVNHLHYILGFGKRTPPMQYHSAIQSDRQEGLSPELGATEEPFHVGKEASTKECCSLSAKPHKPLVSRGLQRALLSDFSVLSGREENPH